MQYRVAICDDESQQALQLKTTVEAWAKEVCIPCNIQCFPSAEAFWFTYEADDTFDILLLDVEMKDMNGIQLAKRLRAEGCRAEIVFITSHFEFIGDGYEVDALHYLVKPVTKEKLFHVLSRAVEKLAVEPPSVLLSCDGATVKLYETDIMYAEAFLHDIVIHTRTGEYRTKKKISDFELQLSKDFFRIHRSYLVNLKSVQCIGRTSVILEGGADLPLARGKYNDMHRAFIDRN